MGTMTVAEMTTELRFLLKNRDDAAVNPARVERWINAAYRHCTHPSVHKHWECMARFDVTLVTGGREYPVDLGSIGFNIVGIRHVFYYLSATVTHTGNRRHLRPRSLDWINSRPAPMAAPTGYAFDYTTGLKLLVLDTQPTAAENGHQLRVNCWRELDALVTAQQTALNDYWDRVVLKGAQWMAEEDLGYRELAEATKQQYVGLLNEAWNDFQLNADDSGFQTPIRTESPMEY